VPIFFGPTSLGIAQTDDAGFFMGRKWTTETSSSLAH